MEQFPRIHVIIPVYNAVNYLQEAVDSVLNQPYKGIDIVLVDDGSTDGSSALCDTIAAKEARVSVLHQENAGVSAARNAGIGFFLNNAGADDYLAFLDADDFWFSSLFTDALCGRLSLPDKADVYLFGSSTCNESATCFSVPVRYEDRITDGGNAAIWKSQCSFCANLYHIKLFQKWNIRFQNGLRYSEDKILLQQCMFLAEKVHFKPQIMHCYREVRSSAMKNFFSINPIEYYLPIINGWIESDIFLNRFHSITDCVSSAGSILAGIYFMDMAMDHYKRWKTPPQLKAVYETHSYYYLLKEMRPVDVSPQQYANHNLLLNHPLLFQLKYNLIGALEFGARCLLQLPFIYRYRQHKKYPLTQLPEDCRQLN